MKFGNPEALRLLFVIPFLILMFWWSYRRNNRLLVELGETDQLKSIYRRLTAIFLIMVTSVVVAAARPQINLHSSAQRGPRGDYVLLVDVSRSMAARSSPNALSNLDLAKGLMKRLVNQVPDARFLIFGYAGLAFPLSTFSDERDYLNDVIEHGVYVDVIPKPGSDLTNALQSLDTAKNSNTRYAGVSQIVLLADGNMGELSEESTVVVVDSLRRAGVALITVGVGAVEGQYVPEIDSRGRFSGGYETLVDGRLFATYLQERTLETLANKSGGKYFPVSEADQLIAHVRRTQPALGEVDLTEPILVGFRDVSWMLLLPLSGALGLLIWRRHDLY